MSPPPPPPSVGELLRHRQFVRNLANRLASDPNDAADVRQQAWLKIVSRPPSHSGSIRSWLACVVRSVAVSKYQSDSTRQFAEAGQREPDSPPSPQEVMERRELEAQLSRAVDLLSDSQAQAIRMRYYEGLSLREIAERENTSIETVRSRVKRGLQKLRLSLDESYAPPRKSRSLFALPGLLRGRQVPLPSAGLAAAILLPLVVASALFWWMHSIPVARAELAAVPELAPTDAAPAKSIERSTSERSMRAPLATSAPLDPALTVRFVDQLDGAPVSGLFAYLHSSTSGVEAMSSVSDAEGRIHFAALAADLWRVTPERGEPTSIRLEPGLHEQLEIRVPPGVELRGRVVDPLGAPLPGAQIWVSAPRSRELGRIAAVTDTSGHFELQGIDRNAWVGAREPSYRPSRLRWSQAAMGRQHIELALRGACEFHGYVRDDSGLPVAGAQISYRPIERAPPRFDRNGVLGAVPPIDPTTTDAQGRFEIPSVLLAAGDLDVSHADFEPKSHLLHLAAGDRDLWAGEGSFEVRLTRRSQAAPALERPALEGVALDESGFALPNARVVALRTDRKDDPLSFLSVVELEELSAITQPDGQFRIELPFDRSGSPYDVYLLTDDAFNSPPRASLSSVTADQPIVLRETWSLPSTITGHLELGEHGRVHVLLSSPALPTSLARTVYAREVFVFDDLPAADYSVAILTGDNLRSNVAQVTLGPNAHEDLGALHASQRSAIRVTVVAENADIRASEAVAWVEVEGRKWLIHKGQDTPRLHFSDDGVLTMPDTAPGSYRVLVSIPDFGSASCELTLAANEQRDIPLVVQPGIAHEIRLTSRTRPSGEVRLHLLDSSGNTRKQAFKRTLEDGVVGFRIRLAPGRYTLSSTLEGQAERRVEFEAKEYPSTTTIDLDSGELSEL